MFERILHITASVSSIDQICRKHDCKGRRGIYSVVVVVWLMIYQRLHSKGTLSSAVQFLARKAIHWQCAPVGKRMREGRISTATGGYCQARRRMPKLVASSDVCDHIVEQLQALMREPLPDVLRPVFLMDGTSLRLAHERELMKAFPPGRNQHGENHWPTLRMVAFHDAQTGLAARPSWGPM